MPAISVFRYCSFDFDGLICNGAQQLQQLQRFIRLADLPNYVGLKRTQIYELIKQNKFPKPIALTDSGAAKAWLESEILAWQATMIAQDRAAVPVPKAVTAKRAKNSPV